MMRFENDRGCRMYGPGIPLAWFSTVDFPPGLHIVSTGVEASGELSRDVHIVLYQAIYLKEEGPRYLFIQHTKSLQS